ncbi:type I 3-dehydroquinase-domain-containing protein [Xylaria curta]|nr:type I 3-dehydroquinase-domain-containing protein [Xylaria curta]
MKTKRRKVSLPPASRRSSWHPAPCRLAPARSNLNTTALHGSRRPADASILIVGIRGTGKTTLAILASASLGFKVVDADQRFHQITGMSTSAYISRYGVDQYRDEELRLMSRLLESHPLRCIIVSGQCSTSGASRSLIKTFMIDHPVIFVMRDLGDVGNALGTNDVARILHISELASPRYRSASNFEFYNLSNQNAGLPIDHRYLTLKHAEVDFVRLIHSIRSQDPCPRTLQAQHSLAFLPPEAKPYSYALTLPLDIISDLAPELSSTDFAVDAVQVIIDLGSILKDGRDLDQTAATYITRQYYVLRRCIKLPVIIHVDARPSQVRSPSAKRMDIWRAYAGLIFHVLRLAPEYTTLNLECEPNWAERVLRRRGFTKIIGHYFDPTTDPAAWQSHDRLEVVQKADQWGCDLVRVCQQCTCQEDNAATQRFITEVKKSAIGRLPIIAYNVGYAGRGSFFTNRILTPVTHELIKKARLQEANQPGWMITLQEAQRALYGSFSLDSLVFGLLGSAGASSMAPMMHNAAFKFCGMPHEFKLFPSASLDDIKVVVSDPRFGGATVRYPFKQDIISTLEFLSPEAQAIGAVNTIIPLRRRNLESLVLDRNRAGPVAALFGDNTDWIGVYESVQRNLSPINSVRSRTTALIIGAGSLARSAVYAAIQLQVRHIFIQNRTFANAEKLVRHFNDKIFPLHNIELHRASLSTSRIIIQNRSIDTPDKPFAGPAKVQSISSVDEPWPAGFETPTIIVSCIPRFTRDGSVVPNITLPEAWFTRPTGGVVVDLAYNLASTPLLEQVRSLARKEWIAVNGLQVIPEQGFAQFELFTGLKAPRCLMRSKYDYYIQDQS